MFAIVVCCLLLFLWCGLLWFVVVAAAPAVAIAVALAVAVVVVGGGWLLLVLSFLSSPSLFCLFGRLFWLLSLYVSFVCLC